MDLQLSGAAAQYGRGMIADVTVILMKDFALNVQDRIARIERGESLDSLAASGSSVSGFGIAMAAMRLALTRVLRRFFVPYQPAAT
jgi:uncharacterized protein